MRNDNFNWWVIQEEWQLDKSIIQEGSLIITPINNSRKLPHYSRRPIIHEERVIAWAEEMIGSREIRLIVVEHRVDGQTNQTKRSNCITSRQLVRCLTTLLFPYIRKCSLCRHNVRDLNSTATWDTILLLLACIAKRKALVLNMKMLIVLSEWRHSVRLI